MPDCRSRCARRPVRRKPTREEPGMPTTISKRSDTKLNRSSASIPHHQCRRWIPASSENLSAVMVHSRFQPALLRKVWLEVFSFLTCVHSSRPTSRVSSAANTVQSGWLCQWGAPSDGRRQDCS